MVDYVFKNTVKLITIFIDKFLGGVWSTIRIGLSVLLFTVIRNYKLT